MRCVTDAAGGDRYRPAGGNIAGGGDLTETIFSWPGLGRWLIDALHAATIR